MPGPAPDPDAIRRNKRPDWITLPTSGRTGDPPPWPLPSVGHWTAPAMLADGDDKALERLAKLQSTYSEFEVYLGQLWAQLWRTPQAIMWEKAGDPAVRLVARYARMLLLVETLAVPVSQQAECRQIEDRLGLTPMALKRLQWIIADEATEADLDVEVPDDLSSLFG